MSRHLHLLKQRVMKDKTQEVVEVVEVSKKTKAPAKPRKRSVRKKAPVAE